MLKRLILAAIAFILALLWVQDEDFPWLAALLLAVVIALLVKRFAR